jgi:hypothetical protein
VWGDWQSNDANDLGMETDHDGNDIIDIGDDNVSVTVWGQGGNDKIIGGQGEN